MTSSSNSEFTTTISTVHPDIIQTHIFTRLDGPTLASASCASSQLQALSSEENLWRDISTSTWPSISHPRVRQLISSFPAGHRSFFSDSFPLLDHRYCSSSPPQKHPDHHRPLSELISAVDIHYKDKLIFSKVQETQTETETGWFLCSPFRVDLLAPKESVQTPIRHGENQSLWLKHLEENLTLSWIVIDPTRNRAANISSRSPVWVQRHWLTGEVQLRYVTIMAGGDQRSASYSYSYSSTEFVQCGVVVTCGGKVGGEMHVREVSMVMEDMEGKHLNGKDSLVILQRAIESGKRKKQGRGGEGKERFEEYEEMKRERKERKERRERALDTLCIATAFTLFLAFWSFFLFR